MSAKALTDVRAVEFEAAAVRRLCPEDTDLGCVFVLACAEVIGPRLEDARTRLLDLYGPYGRGLSAETAQERTAHRSEEAEKLAWKAAISPFEWHRPGRPAGSLRTSSSVEKRP